jgi:hypothetical protein
MEAYGFGYSDIYVMKDSRFNVMAGNFLAPRSTSRQLMKDTGYTDEALDQLEMI